MFRKAIKITLKIKELRNCRDSFFFVFIHFFVNFNKMIIFVEIMRQWIYFLIRII